MADLTVSSSVDTMMGSADNATIVNNIGGASSTGSGGLVRTTSPTLVTPILGVAAATTINKVALTAPATGSTLTIADGKTLTSSNTLTLAGTDGTTQTFQASDTIVGRATTDTLTNKRITPRIQTAADATSITPDSDAADIVLQINTQATGTLTINAPTGTPTQGQVFELILDSTNVQTFSFNAIYRGGTDIALPTVSTAAKRDRYVWEYDATDTKWDIVGMARGY